MLREGGVLCHNSQNTGDGEFRLHRSKNLNIDIVIGGKEDEFIREQG